MTSVSNELRWYAGENSGVLTKSDGIFHAFSDGCSHVRQTATSTK